MLKQQSINSKCLREFGLKYLDHQMLKQVFAQFYYYLIAHYNCSFPKSYFHKKILLFLMNRLKRQHQKFCENIDQDHTLEYLLLL